MKWVRRKDAATLNHILSFDTLEVFAKGVTKKHSLKFLEKFRPLWGLANAFFIMCSFKLMEKLMRGTTPTGCCSFAGSDTVF